MNAKPAFFAALAALLVPLGADAHTAHTSPTSVAPSGIPFRHPNAGEVAPSVRPFTDVNGDGSNPVASLIDVNGVLYGTTRNGGPYNGGTVFAVTTSGQESVIHSFTADAAFTPVDGLIDVNGTLYGTTLSGDAPGTVFGIKPTGQGYRVVYSFGNGTDGTSPQAGLVTSDKPGVLLGTTSAGGQYGFGTVFGVSTTAYGEGVVYNFTGGADGGRPWAGLINVNGVYYGTTSSGGQYGAGTVFAITTSGQETVIHSFGNGPDGKDPQAGLIDVNGVLYGTTAAGGRFGGGTVFAVATTGDEAVLYSFGGGHGAYPYAGLTYVNGLLYGTTVAGGAYNAGTVFAVYPQNGLERVVHSFGGAPDGSAPRASLIDVNGVLYGTTSTGGKYSQGTVFAVTTSGQESVIYSFFGYTIPGSLSSVRHN